MNDQHMTEDRTKPITQERIIDSLTRNGFALIENSLGQMVYVDNRSKAVRIDDRKLRSDEAYMVGC